MLSEKQMGEFSNLIKDANHVVNRLTRILIGDRERKIRTRQTVGDNDSKRDYIVNIANPTLNPNSEDGNAAIITPTSTASTPSTTTPVEVPNSIEKLDLTLINIPQRKRSITGAGKMIRKAQADLTFLSNVEIPKRDHLTGNNVSFFKGLLGFLEQEQDVIAVDQQFDGGTEQFVSVDIVSNKGKRWVKVSARAKDAIIRVVRGQGSFGQKSILDTAQNLQRVAECNRLDFQPPQIVMAFSQGVYDCVCRDLEALDVCVVGQVVPCNYRLCDSCVDNGDDDDDDNGDDDDDTNNNDDDNNNNVDTGRGKGKDSDVDNEISVLSATGATLVLNKSRTLNLDISTMIVLVSDLANLDQTSPEELAKGRFTSRPIQSMAEQERLRPVLKVLLPQLEGTTLVACKTAVESLSQIVNEVGGEAEIKRAHELLARVIVVEDVASTRCIQLKCSTKIKEKAKIVFGVGDQLQIKTVSANCAFVRAAAGQNIHLSVITHEGRALCGQAKRVDPLDT